MPGAIDLLLTDVVTPLMRGSQLAQEFRVIRPGAKVLFMSAYNVHQVEAYRVKLAPGEPFLKKPFTMDELQRGEGGPRLPAGGDLAARASKVVLVRGEQEQRRALLLPKAVDHGVCRCRQDCQVCQPL